MIKFLIKKFIKDYDNTSDNNVRESYGVLSGVLGIICNLILFIIKIFIGSVMGSIAIISDAFNNLSDTGSSAVTIIGTKLSNARADREHPFGHGRIEYISSLIVSFIIILVGFELFKSSVSKIISPEAVSFNPILTVILVISVLIKVWMYLYNRYMGRKINSKILLATAQDSKNDVIATLSVIAATVLDSFLPFSTDGYVGAVVSGLIMFSGFSIAKDTIGVLLGTPPEKELVDKIESLIMSAEDITGVHDLIVHDYGPGRIMASVHAEVPADCDIIRIHEIIDKTETIIENELGVHIVIHMDPVITNCEKTNSIKEFVNLCISEMSSELSIHDFRMTDGEEKINLIFDLCVPVEVKDSERKEIIDTLNNKLKERDKRFNTVIHIDNIV